MRARLTTQSSYGIQCNSCKLHDITSTWLDAEMDLCKRNQGESTLIATKTDKRAWKSNIIVDFFVAVYRHSNVTFNAGATSTNNV